MPSTYTTNLGIEKIATGEQSGTWGTTTNTNLDLLDEAVNGIISITLSSAGSSGSPTALPITDGASSNGRNKFIEFVDGGDLGGTAYVQLTPNNAEKIVHIRNSLSGSRSVIVFQGTYNASNDFEIVSGADVLLKFNGGGSGATVTDVNVDLTVTGLTVTTANATTVNATTVDTTNLEVTNLKAKDGTAAGSIANSTGVVTIASAVLTTADINGGTADNVTIGGSTAAVGTFTTANATTVDATNLEVTNLKAKDGTAAGSIADSTGVVTVASAVLTTADINGGTADAVTIGGSTAAAGTFTAGVFTTAVASTETDTSNSGSITLDFSADQNFVLTLTGNVTLANPSTEILGQSGFIVFIQDGTGSRTVSLGTDYETASGAGLTLSSAASTTDIVPYVVAASGRILLGAPQLAFS
tara:strand:- start:7008 stop:8249 length:1242 start_codon:yes stop_codon:yes gene_type:complete